MVVVINELSSSLTALMRYICIRLFLFNEGVSLTKACFIRELKCFIWVAEGRWSIPVIAVYVRDKTKEPLYVVNPSQILR